MSGQLSNSATAGGSAAFANGDPSITGLCNSCDVRNNIFNLTGTVIGGNLYAYTTQATTLTGFIQNYNVLRAVGTGGTNNTGRFNAMSFVTLAAWQTASGLDLNSFSQNPQYNSTTDLHINPAIGTPVESGATPVSITVDYDGNTRNATTPDIGADEGTFTLLLMNDVRAAAFIAPVNNADIAQGVAFIPSASFENLGTNTQTNVPVRYHIVGPSPATTEVYNDPQTIASMASGAIVTAPFTSTTLAAAGTYSIFAKSELVGDQNTANDELMGTINVLPPLNGTYDVGASQPAPFNTLTGALSRLSNVGVSGPVTFRLTDATYPSETFPIVINAFTGASATNTLTIKPQTTSSITGSSANCIIRLNGADYVI
ncbi:MAG: hypothetical protein AAB263_16445, partial [Planctomycetota bacterium]